MQPICLTFDNGPEPEVTPGVLETLARRRIPAMFFVVGEKLRDPARHALAARARAEGHPVGNHTLTHGTPLGRRGGTEAVAEIEACEALLAGLQAPERLFRPNGGGGTLGPHLLNASAARRLQAGSHTVVLWNAIPRDFEDPEGWPDRALAMHAEATAPVLMVLHDLPNGAMRHLDRVLGTLQDRGAVFLAEPPEACVPMRRGVALPGLEACVSPDAAP
ncbi:polysaccharide deacetylase family protein [Paracraurococcus lichenis]|uniref:Chitooligosaccharide deacetylase n=1 Tax=Paracraurococcus lichenis TaxID=3064888 RepID=A0ABT9DSK6_9PROT|nr:polysaccharide deacetylase family protein [Paracraurococcus sp. LOR1-02]MDO9706883.1 polysaccharide deacetylase family protein [Paracraurococcus sp. LOR1-02]